MPAKKTNVMPGMTVFSSEGVGNPFVISGYHKTTFSTTNHTNSTNRQNVGLFLHPLVPKHQLGNPFSGKLRLSINCRKLHVCKWLKIVSTRSPCTGSSLYERASRRDDRGWKPPSQKKNLLSIHSWQCRGFRV